MKKQFKLLLSFLLRILRTSIDFQSLYDAGTGIYCTSTGFETFTHHTLTYTVHNILYSVKKEEREKSNTMPTFLITGCSSGIGLQLVRDLCARGDTVYATCRTRHSSFSGVDNLSSITGDNLHIIEGIDVAIDNVGEKLSKALEGVVIDVCIHNAGSLNATRDIKDVGAMFGEQKLESISMDRMRAVFELNTLGPLRVMKAVLPNMCSPGGKVISISTGLGSISDNGSGGNYAYRASKAALNMITKNFSCDLSSKGIACAAVAPGTIATDFGPGPEAMQKFGAKPPSQASLAIIQICDGLTMEKTGQFIMIPTNGDPPQEFPW